MHLFPHPPEHWLLACIIVVEGMDVVHEMGFPQLALPHATLYDLEEDAPVQMWVMIEHAPQKWDPWMMSEKHFALGPDIHPLWWD